MNELKDLRQGDRKIDIVIERCWHIGQHIHALNTFDALSHVYGGFPAYRYQRVRVSSKQLSTFPIPALWNFLCMKTRLPRWLTLEEPKWVGNWAASKKLAKYVCCYATAYRYLFPLLANSEHILILERGSTHAENYFHSIERAKKEAGLPYSKTLPPAITDEIARSRLAHFVVAGSDMMVESFVSRGFPTERILKCTYGIHTDRFPFAKRSVPHGRPLRICMVGVIGIRKGVLRLTRINEWAKARGYDTELWLVGPVWPEAEEILAKTNAPVRLCGVKKGADLLEILHQCDLYSIGSYEEGFGLSVVEAMCTGLPAVVSSETGAKEAIVPGVNGVVLQDYTPEEFDRLLGPLFSQPQRLVDMAAAARDAVLSNYTVEHYTQRIRAEYTRMFEMVEAYGTGVFPACF